jgi:hypothetical protein
MKNLHRVKLEIIYKNIMYEKPTTPPLINPFFLILLEPMLLPTNILIAVITNITGAVVTSLIFVYVNSIEKINNNNRVIKYAITIPFIIGIILFLLSVVV